MPIKYDAGFGVNFAIGVAIVGGESFTMEHGGRVIKVLARGAHTVRIVDPKAGFFHKPDWAPYEVTLDLASLDEPMVILEARNRGYKWVLSVRILSASAEVEKHEIAIR